MTLRASLQTQWFPVKHSSTLGRTQMPPTSSLDRGGGCSGLCARSRPPGGRRVTATQILAGTSGFSYKEWRGPFYPPKLAAKAMLGYYATRLPIVEINNTFYRLPKADMLVQWRAQVPEAFRFAIKAPRRITHLKRLKDCDEELRFFLATLEALGAALGSILFQLPPFFRCDVPTLAAFVRSLPKGTKAAFEFRHDSWFDAGVIDLLAAHGLPLVVSETDDAPARNLPWTADWTYLRLRKSSYAEGELARWVDRLVDAGLEQAQVFFKHEDEAAGPRFAEAFLEIAAGRGARR